MSELDLTGRTLGGYRVEGLLGRGAFGWVFRAHQLSLDRTVALKVLDPVVARNPDAARRFDREGRSAAALDHPAIVDVYDADSAGGLHYIAMRLIDGIALDELLRRRRLGPGELAAILRRIAPALDHAHARGVVHRDVKPANILLQQGDPGRAWLGDFGIAVSMRVAGTLSTATVGTAHYMAPEQLEPPQVGPPADQYSLACVAFEVLTGRPPFGADTDDVMAVLLAHRTDSAPPTGSAALDAVFARALARNPADRYPTAAGFAATLDRALRTPAAKGARRRWLVAGGVAVVAAGAVAAFTLPGNANAPSTASTRSAPEGWTTVRGPASATFRVPPGWRREDTGAVATFTDAGTQVLVVGGERSDTGPADDLRALYECTGRVDSAPVAGLSAAACDVHGRHATVVADHGTIVRFAFEAKVPVADRDRVLASLTIR
ncbi:MAG TPA: serine/threonine-protein kinase [Actinophytocola sp.]|nr:serine/threonine-protein kinase [Actinophytocola sp.]